MVPGLDAPRALAGVALAVGGRAPQGARVAKEGRRHGQPVRRHQPGIAGAVASSCTTLRPLGPCSACSCAPGATVPAGAKLAKQRSKYELSVTDLLAPGCGTLQRRRAACQLGRGTAAWRQEPSSQVVPGACPCGRRRPASEDRCPPQARPRPMGARGPSWRASPACRASHFHQPLQGQGACYPAASRGRLASGRPWPRCWRRPACWATPAPAPARQQASRSLRPTCSQGAAWMQDALDTSPQREQAPAASPPATSLA